ncbi:MAG: adenylate kinase [Chloroflexota bacterium]
MPEPFPYTRLVVVGVTGSGKSTLAEGLAQKLGLDFVELDALYWKPGWEGTPDDEFAAKVEAATRGDRWAVAGNYSRVRPITWPRAQAVIWIDYPLWTVFRRLLRRTLHRAVTREVLWGTNTEPFWPHLKLWSDESLFKWLFKTYRRRKRDYPLLLAMPQYAHLKVFHFKEPQETDAWLESLAVTLKT